MINVKCKYDPSKKYIIKNNENFDVYILFRKQKDNALDTYRNYDCNIFAKVSANSTLIKEVKKSFPFVAAYKIENNCFKFMEFLNHG